MFIDKMNIAFVAHEFGLYYNHGGIASYLYFFTKWILEKTDVKITILAIVYDFKCELINKYQNRFSIIKICGNNLASQRDFVCKYLEKLCPDYVEFAEYLALGLHFCLKHRNDKKTIIITNNHTASRECFCWSTGLDDAFIPIEIQQLAFQESLQMKCSDFCIAPSKFLAHFVYKNYNLNYPVLFFFNPYYARIIRKEDLRRKLSLDTSIYEQRINVVLITRFERRKRQEDLIKALIRIISSTKIPLECHLAGNSEKMANNTVDYRYYIYNLIPDTLVDKFHFYDFADKNLKDRLMSIADLTILPSFFENCPGAIIESILMDVPAIGSFYSGIADYSPCELLFDPFDSEDLYRKIMNFLLCSSEKRRQLKNEQKLRLLDLLKPENCIIPRFYLTKRNHLNDDVYPFKRVVYDK